MMKYTIFFLLLVTILSCNTKNEELIVSKTNFALTHEQNLDKVSNKHGKLNINNIPGIYEGLLPCSDCENIDITVILKDNRKYYLRMKHLGSDKKEIREWGKFEWVDNENNIFLKNGSNMEFKVGEDRLWLVKCANLKTIKLGNNTNFILQKK